MARQIGTGRQIETGRQIGMLESMGLNSKKAKKKKHRTKINTYAKGHTFERDIAKKFKDLYALFFGSKIPFDFKRGIQSVDGTDAPDVETPHFYIECKFHSQEPNIRKALEQAYKARKKTDKRYVIAITKTNYQKPIVGMYLEDFFNFIKMNVDMKDIRITKNKKK